MTISTDLIRAAAGALASALPVPAELTAGPAVTATEFSGSPASFLPANAGAAVVAKTGEAPGSSATGHIAVIVDAQLVTTLATSPMGALDVAAAVQPALDAAAHAVSGAAASAAQQLDVEPGLSALLARPGALLVPLADADGAVVAAFVIALESAATPGTQFVPGAGTSAPTADVPLPRQGGTGNAALGASHARGGLDLLRDVAMEITVELGRTRMTVRELLSLTPGAVIELDRAAGSPADLLVNGTLIARGEIVVVDEDFGIRITEIVAAGPDAATAPSAARFGAA